MSTTRKRNLSKARTEERAAFRRREKAHKRYMNARKKADEAYDNMLVTREGYRLARDELNREYELAQRNSSRYRADIWSEYRQLQRHHEEQIRCLRREIDSEHEQMMSCYRQAQDARNQGKKAESILWMQEGQDHADCCDALKIEVEELYQYIKDKQEDAGRRAKEAYGAKFQAIRAEFEKAKGQYEIARNEFEHLRAERERLKTEFDSVRQEHELAKNKLKKLLGV